MYQHCAVSIPLGTYIRLTKSCVFQAWVRSSHSYQPETLLRCYAVHLSIMPLHPMPGMGQYSPSYGCNDLHGDLIL
jgi:hypothetical protein